MPSKKTFRKSQPAAPPPPDGALQSLLDALAEYDPRIQTGGRRPGCSCVANLSYDRRRNPHQRKGDPGQQRGATASKWGLPIVAKSRLDTLHKAAVEVLRAKAESLNIDPTPLFLSAEIARRIYGAGLRDCFTLDPKEASGWWPECSENDISD